MSVEKLDRLNSSNMEGSIYIPAVKLDTSKPLFPY